VASVPELPYPSCGLAPLPPGDVVASGHLRAGPFMREQNLVERFEIRRRDCLYVATVRQEWPLATADLDVAYDDHMLPLRIWKRMTLPGTPDGRPEIARYELRTPETTITRRAHDGRRTYEILRGPRPRAVIGPGRGVLTMWLWRAHLPVGGRLREPVIDVRAELELIHDVTLRREPDRYEPSLGRTVRVYTVYGREPIYADEHDVVIGDIAGMRPSGSLGTPEPPALPLYGPPDPVHTP
jgi:hypothetical protein